jgi:hypothetical protein
MNFNTNLLNFVSFLVEEDVDNKKHGNLLVGEKNLIVNIILLALTDLKRMAHRESAIIYFKSETFEMHCDLLEVSHEKLRNKILESIS